uniref:Uncharacterized protein n=1 Tax=Ralstonia solanacearum TaxID=305 RepID=A0A0S4VKG9_RALSL|nr:protein of unknown function [Ralstonia solanacearum]CUV28136.1 protein of unknown function [Ralstonia solanacearum]CUV35043.1 protein of unknown function [Ralstonia solanacearum]CUV38485.1 protein of unknown function [Ralstonia solanacearum]CUV59122.1 protein of unknown function [Ralstonia solanacearum]
MLIGSLFLRNFDGPVYLPMRETFMP